MKNTIIYILSLVLLIAVSCRSEVPEEEQQIDDVQLNNLVFSDEQKSSGGIVSGKLVKRQFSKVIVCNGNVESTPGSRALVTSPHGGVIKSIDHFIGEKIKKDEVLITLENSEFIKLQENYLITLGEYAFLENDYLRKEELFKDKAVSEKEYLRSKADFLTIEAKKLSLTAQLNLLSVDVNKIRQNGLISTLQLKSPINGHISKILGNVGKYVDNQEVLFEIVDAEKLHLHLKVFEKDISKISVGQEVSFSTLSEPNKKYSAEIFSLGHSINDLDHSITVHATIINHDENLIPGLFVNAGIFTSSDNFFSIPFEGLIKGENVSYIFIEKEGDYMRIPVEAGIENDNYISIINPDQNILDANVVVKGAYFINAALEGSEEE